MSRVAYCDPLAGLITPSLQVPRTHVDDEYAHAGEVDPKVLLTTSRNPSSRLVQFAKVRAQPATLERCWQHYIPRTTAHPKRGQSISFAPFWGVFCHRHAQKYTVCKSRQDVSQACTLHPSSDRGSMCDCHPCASQEMKLVVPNSQRVNRGGMVLSELVESCRSHDFTDLVILHEHRGEPGVWGCHM